MTESIDENRQAKHDLKKSIRRLKLIMDHIESKTEGFSSEEFQKVKNDFDEDLQIIAKSWDIYQKTILKK